METAVKAYEAMRGIFQAFIMAIGEVLVKLGWVDEDGWIKGT